MNNYADIKKRLAEPVPANIISRREGGKNRSTGQTFYVDYINVTDYKDLLDARAGIWEAFVSDYKQIGECLCCVVKIIIHTDDGAFAQDGTGIESMNMTGFGDPFSNSYAQAFRRACEGHGLSRELWRKDDHAPAADNSYPSHSNSPANPNNAQAPKQFTNTKPASVFGTIPATEKQIGALRAIAKNNDIDLRVMVENEFEPVDSLDAISKDAASYLISICSK